MHIHDDENKPVRMLYNVTSERVNHYNDVIEAMTSTAISKFIEKHKKRPQPQAVAFYKKELVRVMTIQRDIRRAEKIQIQESVILNEQYQD
jgi:hypothetical protein